MSVIKEKWIGLWREVIQMLIDYSIVGASVTANIYSVQGQLFR
jgi:hypothetical protein